ncbi:uncharacterized protein LOC135153047 [Daucus carota subsp. sativus]|uniref:uncharacterized protein LOC135153047 n=1 Tax=Daucus carota subsp. sativus TaxID=79200 RepID=UPI003082BDF4
MKKNRIHSAFDRPLTMWEKYCLHHCFAFLLGFTLPANFFYDLRLSVAEDYSVQGFNEYYSDQTGSQGYLFTSYKGTCSIQILLKVQMSNRVNHVKCTSVIHRFDTLRLQPLGDIYQGEHFVNSLKDEVNIIKKLRCKCNFHAPKSVPKLQEAGSLIIKRIRKSDVSTNLVDKEVLGNFTTEAPLENKEKKQGVPKLGGNWNKKLNLEIYLKEIRNCWIVCT